jgi:hypothetical protein
VIGRYAVLASRIRQNVADIETVVRRVDRALEALEPSNPERDLLIDSIALNLHDFYTGLERVFTRIASELDESVPSGTDWHRELLGQMSTEIQGVRPRAISAKTANDVDEFLRFRHVVRHVYAFELNPQRVIELAKSLRSTFLAVESELSNFGSYLESLVNEA